MIEAFDTEVWKRLLVCVMHLFSLLSWSDRVGNKARVSGLIAEYIWGSLRENSDLRLKITPPPLASLTTETLEGLRDQGGDNSKSVPVAT